MTPVSPKRGDIEGIRGLAILVVVAFHAGLTPFPGGFAGVDMFFVLSGYLIWAGFAAADAKGTPLGVGDYCLRRLRRLVPALFVFLLVTVSFALILYTPRELMAYGERLFAASSFTSNIHYWQHAGYFAAESSTLELLHLWSLGVEGQWYLLAPFAYYGLRRATSMRKFSILTLVFALSLALWIYAAIRAPSAGFYLLPPRLWEFVAGILAAQFGSASLLRIKGSMSSVIAGVAFLMMILPVLTADASDGAAALPTIVLVLGTAVLITMGRVHPATLANRMLSHPTFRYAGRVSYSWYLYHWPALVMPALFLSRALNGVETVIAVAGSFTAAALSTHFVEQPFLMRGLKFHNMSFARSSVFYASALLPIAIAALAFVHANGFPARVAPGVVAMEREMLAGGQGNSCTDASGKSCLAPTINTVVWGDSHAEQWMPTIRKALPGASVARLGMAGCPPILGVKSLTFGQGQKPDIARANWNHVNQCLHANDIALRALKNAPQVKRVILGGAWQFYSEGRDPEERTGRYLSFASVGTASTALSRATMTAGLAEMVKRLRAMGIRILLIGDNPAYGSAPTTCLLRSMMFNRSASHCGSDVHGLEALERSNAILRNAANGKDVTVYLPSDDLCPRGRCQLNYAGHVLYRDGDHLTTAAAEALSPSIRQVLD